MGKVNVYHNGEIIGRVNYNRNLDVWNGHNWQNGGTGHHLGITKLKRTIDGMKFVLIYGTDWQGGIDYAELVTDEIAKRKILEAENEELLQKYFKNENFDLEEED